MKAGGCGAEKTDWIARVERRNQIVERKTFFHTISFQGYIDVLPKDSYFYEHSYWNWVLLKHNPYIPVFKEKILQTSETGLNEKFWNEAVPFKITEEEPLEALKLEHFYIMFIGNAIGILLAFATFLIEKIIRPKVKSAPGKAAPEGTSRQRMMMTTQAPQELGL